MRIGLDVTPLAIPLTGIGTIVHRLAAALHADPSFTLAPFALTGKSAERVRKNLPSGSVLPRPIPAALAHGLWRYLDYPTVETLTRGPVDLVHGTNFYGIPGGRATELITIHDTGPWVRPDAVAPAVQAFPKLVNRALGRGAHVHTLSVAAGEEISALLGLPTDRVHPVQIGFDRPSEQTRRPQQFPVSTDERFVLAVGSIEPRKRLPQLVDRLAANLAATPDLHLVIAGDGPDAAALDHTVASHHLEARVHRLGYVSNEEKSWLLRQADVVVSNSSSEGFGMVPLEAMSVQTPTVSTDGAVQREVCGSAAVLVEVDDADAMSAAIDNVLSDRALQSRLIAAGTKQAAKFSWERTMSELFSLYRSLAR